MKTLALRHLFMTAALLVCASPVSGQVQGAKENAPAPSNAIDVGTRYVLSGFMGDGEDGKKWVQVDEACKTSPKSGPTCIKVRYSLGAKLWAGAYWFNKPNNWGDKPGEDFSSRGFQRVAFFARGEKGGEIVEFKSGGVDSPGKKYKDSFEESTGKVTLEKEWKRYTIDLKGQNLSSVIGLFCWVANDSNPKEITFYLDDIRYE